MSKTKLDTLNCKLKKCQTRLKRLGTLKRNAEREQSKLYGEIHRETLRQAIGQPVKRKYRSSERPLLNDAVGMLVSVRRTRCTVKYGRPIYGSEEWHMPIDYVCLAEAEQGWFIEL